MIIALPSDCGAVQLTVMSLTPFRVAVTVAGAPGAIAGAATQVMEATLHSGVAGVDAQSDR